MIKIIKTTKIDYSKVSSDTAVDLMKKLFVLDPEERLSFDEFFVHPYIRNIFKERESKGEIHRKLSNLSPLSPRKLKISPFKDEQIIQHSELEVEPINLEEKKPVVSKSDHEDFLVIDFKNQPLTSLLKISESGDIIYPTKIFDFSTSKFDENNEEQIKIINQIENIGNQCWSIAELAFILEKSGSDKTEPLSLYIKSLLHLYDLVRYIKQTIPQELICERILKLVQWSERCYIEFLEYANNISQNLPLSCSIETCPEELMYKYAIKTAKDSAFTEFLHNPDLNSLNMYKRCVYIFDYLNSNKKFEDEDKKWLKLMTNQIKLRIDKFPTEKMNKIETL